MSDQIGIWVTAGPRRRDLDLKTVQGLESKITELEAKLKVCEDALGFYARHMSAYDGSVARQALEKIKRMK